MRAVAGSTATLAEKLTRCHNVLLQTASMGGQDGEACSRLLSAVTPEQSDVLCVTFNQSPDTRLEHWRTTGGPTEPANLGFVVVEGMRSAAVAPAPSDGPMAGDIGPTIGTVSSPGDLTGLGIELGSFISDWADDDSRLQLCFHTLTTFLQYTDLRTAYQFLHVLTGRVQAVGGRGHYHLDPSAHDERTVNTLLGLFDGVVVEDADGGWDVRRRR